MHVLKEPSTVQFASANGSSESTSVKSRTQGQGGFPSWDDSRDALLQQGSMERRNRQRVGVCRLCIAGLTTERGSIVGLDTVVLVVVVIDGLARCSRRTGSNLPRPRA